MHGHRAGSAGPSTNDHPYPAALNPQPAAAPHHTPRCGSTGPLVAAAGCGRERLENWLGGRPVADHYGEPMVDPSVLRYYGEGSEADRLVAGGVERLEFIRTKELLSRRLGDRPLDILDVGGASGRYASWLAGLGHNVHLIDPVPRHIDQARDMAASGDFFEASRGDARSLAFPDGSFDVVLLLGPLYHLVEPVDRLAALREAHRVLRRSGWLAAAAISRFASSIDGIVKGFAGDPSFRQRVKHALATGTHRNDTNMPGQFTTAYFHRPEELRSELVTADFHVDGLFGIEGPGGYQADGGPDWLDADYRAYIVDLARAVEIEPSFIGFGPHLLALATPMTPARGR